MQNDEKKGEYLHLKIQAKLKIALIQRARKENESSGAIVRKAIRRYLRES